TTPLALLWARRRLHGDHTRTAAYFGVALSFGLMTSLGFASYLLGIAVLIVALTIWLDLLALVDVGAARGHRQEALVTGVTTLLLLAHGFAFAIFIALATVCAAATGRRGARLLRLRALAPVIAFAAWMAWTQRTSALPAGSVSMPNANLALQSHFQGIVDKLSLLFTPTLLTRTGLDTFVGLVLWAVLLGGCVAARREARTPEIAVSWRHTRALLACIGAVLLAFFALPHSVGWFGFIDGRLVPLVLLLAVMAVRRAALGQRFARIYDRTAPIAACAMVVVALVASHFFQSEARGWREVLASVPAQSRLLNLPLDPNSDIFTGHPFVHYDKLVLADRPVVVSDVWFHQGSAIFPTAANPALGLPATYSESNLRFVDWHAYRWSDWDYVLIRTRPAADQPPVPSALALAAHIGGWWLFRTH
ncbi:MAG: hypothetical protein M3O46_05135, partial [Myxococcota bacterium]|nr:hypothetical protein [Myxococcota bacterium]